MMGMEKLLYFLVDLLTVFLCKKYKIQGQIVMPTSPTIFTIFDLRYYDDRIRYSFYDIKIFVQDYIIKNNFSLCNEQPKPTDNANNEIMYISKIEYNFTTEEKINMSLNFIIS